MDLDGGPGGSGSDSGKGLVGAIALVGLLALAGLNDCSNRNTRANLESRSGILEPLRNVGHRYAEDAYSRAISQAAYSNNKNTTDKYFGK